MRAKLAWVLLGVAVLAMALGGPTRAEDRTPTAISEIRQEVSDTEFLAAEMGTVRSDGRGQEPYLIHTIDGVEYRTKISTLRGDYQKQDGSKELSPWKRSRVTRAGANTRSVGASLDTGLMARISWSKATASRARQT